MEYGLNQAVLAKVYRKIETLEYDYSQELLPEAARATGPEIIHTVDFQILYSYGEETYGQLVVPPWMFGLLVLGGAYLFFFDWEKRYAAIVREFLPAKGSYDWVHGLAHSEELTPKRREACRALAASEKEKKKHYEDCVAQGGFPF